MATPAIANLFSLGRILIKPRAHDLLDRIDIVEAMERHAHGDWGLLKPDDTRQNDLALREGGRLVSVYHDRRETTFCIITDSDRSLTTVLLPEEF